MLNEIPVVFHNDSNYDYHFIIKELENEFEGKFEYLCENTENYKTFSIPIEKEVIEIDNGNESVTTMSYEIKFIDSARFMATLLSNLVDNLTERIDKIKCEDCDCFLEYESLRDSLKKHKCLFCNRDDSNIINEELNNRKRIFKFF